MKNYVIGESLKTGILIGAEKMGAGFGAEKRETLEGALNLYV